MTVVFLNFVFCLTILKVCCVSKVSKLLYIQLTKRRRRSIYRRPSEPSPRSDCTRTETARTAQSTTAIPLDLFDHRVPLTEVPARPPDPLFSSPTRRPNAISQKISASRNMTVSREAQALDSKETRPSPRSDQHPDKKVLFPKLKTRST